MKSGGGLGGALVPLCPSWFPLYWSWSHWGCPTAQVGCQSWPPGSPTACPPPHMSLGRASCSLTMGSMPTPLTPHSAYGRLGGCLTWPWQGRTPSHKAAHKRQGQTGLGYEVIWPHLQVRPLTCGSLHSSPDGLFRGPLSMQVAGFLGPTTGKGRQWPWGQKDTDPSPPAPKPPQRGGAKWKQNVPPMSSFKSGIKCWTCQSPVACYSRPYRMHSVKRDYLDSTSFKCFFKKT